MAGQDVDPENFFQNTPVLHKPRYLGVVLLAWLRATDRRAQSRCHRSVRRAGHFQKFYRLAGAAAAPEGGRRTSMARQGVDGKNNFRYRLLTTQTPILWRSLVVRARGYRWPSSESVWYVCVLCWALCKN